MKTIDYSQRASFYDVEYADSVDHGFLRSLVNARTRSILEIPCGAGRNIQVLAAAGQRLVAVDREPAMIERVRRHLARRHDLANVEAVVGDMCTLQLEENFDLIIVPRECFQLLLNDVDAAEALKRFAAHLNPDGQLLVDLATFAAGKPGTRNLQPVYYDPEIADGITTQEWRRPLPTGDFLERSRTQYHLSGDLIEFHFFYRTLRADKSEEASSSLLRLRRYDVDTFCQLARSAGLFPEAIWGDYDKTPYMPGDARMVCLLRPQALRQCTPAERQQ